MEIVFSVHYKMLCKIIFYLLTLQSQIYYREYFIDRDDFVAGTNPHLIYLSTTDQQKINNIYQDWVSYMNGADYTLNIPLDLPTYDAGFQEFSGTYTYRFNDTLTVVVDVSS